MVITLFYKAEQSLEEIARTMNIEPMPLRLNYLGHASV